MNTRRLKKAVKRISHLPLNKNLLIYLGNRTRQLIYHYAKSTRVAWPSNIMLELSAVCNINCSTCPREYDFGKAMSKGFMDKRLAMKIIDQAWPFLDSVGLTGMGETLLYKDLIEIIDYIRSKNKGIIISISTNAQVPDFREKIKALVNKVDTIQISVDGINEIYELIRKKASFSTFDENVKYATALCDATETDIKLNMVVTKENFHHMPLMINYAASLGISGIDFTQLNLAAVTGIEKNYYDFYHSAEFQKIYHEIKETANSIKGITVQTNSFELPRNKHFQNCPFPWTHFYLTWEGYLVPCCAKPFPKELNFGTIEDNSLIGLLNSPGFRSFRKLWLEDNVPAFCRRCHFIQTHA